MAEYIERRRLFNALADYWKIPLDWDGGIAQPCEDALAFIENAPEEDVAPVVHGRWDDCHFVKVDCPKSGFPTVKCSNCEIAFCDLINNHHFMYHYCPNCGARMDGE